MSEKSEPSAPFEATRDVEPEDGMDRLFHALANATRRRILDLVRAHPGWGVGELSACFECSRIAVMKHLKVLEEAALIVSQREGRMRRLYFNVVPIQQVHERWTDEYSALWAGRLTDLKARVERSGIEGSK